MAGLAIGSIALVNACASQGCAGCGLQPIPGGFPQEQRLDNAGQVRVSSSGLDWLGQNFSKLVNAVAGTGAGDVLTFDVPSSCCAGNEPDCSGTQKLCCDGSACNATLEVKNAKLTPQPQGQLRLTADAEVVTSKILLEIKAIGIWFKCEVQYDSTNGSTKTVGVDADIDLVIDANDGNKLKVSRGTTELRDFDCDDISIDEVTWGGWFYCNGADLLCPLFRGTFEEKVRGPIEETVDGMLADLPTGQEGRIDVASLLSYFAHATGLIDFLAWGGGYAESENNGISAGVMIGARAPVADPCVADCEAPGASCQPPPKLALDRVSTFRHNSRPDGKPFHVGLGVHKLALEHATYALYRSGALCLRMDSSTVMALKSDFFALLIPSLAALTGGASVPLSVRLRPQAPPTVELGKGTTHLDDQGEMVIDDPLVTLHAKSLIIDVFMLVEDRWVRLMSVVGDLALPFLLFANADGNLQPILGDLGTSVTNVKVGHSELLAEAPEDLAKLFPSLLSVAGQAMSAGFRPIALPDIQGIQLLLEDGSITSVESNQLLAVFAQLGLTQTTSGPLPSPMVPVEAELDRLELPDASGFSVANRRRGVRPTVILKVAAAGAASEIDRQSAAVQWTYRVDGGFLKPWATLRRPGQLIVHDPSLWLPGEHLIEVFARLEGQSRTMSRTPARVVVDIAPRDPREPLAATDGEALSSSGGGCALGGADVSPGWLLLLLLAVGLRRRRC